MVVFAEKIILIWLVFILCFLSGLFAQNESIEQMETQLAEAADIEEKIDILNNLSRNYYQIDIEKTFHYGEQALELSEENEYPKGFAIASNYLGLGYGLQKDYLKSIEKLKPGLDVSKGIDQPKLTANLLNNLGVNYDELGLSDKAASYYLESLIYSEKAKDDKMLCFTYRNLGMLFEDLGNEAKAREYYTKGAEVASASDIERIKYIPDLDLGNFYLRKKEYKKAMAHLRDSYDLCTDNLCKSNLLEAMAEVHEEQKNWEKAIEQLNLSIEMSRKSGNEYSAENAELKLADILFKQGKYQHCMDVLQNILKNGQNDEDFSFTGKRLHQLLGDTYQELNQYEKATFHFQKYIVIQDSIYDRDKLELIAELEAKHKVNEMERGESILSSEQEQNETIQSNQQNSKLFQILTIVLIAVVAILLFNISKNKQRNSQAI